MIKKVSLLLLFILVSSDGFANEKYTIIKNKADVNIKMSLYPIGLLMGSKATVLCIPARVQFVGTNIIGFSLMGSKSIVKGFAFDGEEVRDEVEHLFIEGGVSFFINNHYYDRDIFAVRTGLYYSDCTYTTDDDYDMDISKNEQLYIVYAGISTTTVSQIEIELTDQQYVKQFGTYKKHFSMQTIYFDLLYELDEKSIVNSFGFRLGTNRTINRFMDLQIKIGYKPIEKFYCLAGLGVYVSF